MIQSTQQAVKDWIKYTHNRTEWFINGWEIALAEWIDKNGYKYGANTENQKEDLWGVIAKENE